MNNTKGMDQPSTLLFPQVEEILNRDGELVLRGKKPQPAVVRKKFQGMAMKVLTKIITDVDEVEDDEDAEESEITVEDDDVFEMDKPCKISPKNKLKSRSKRQRNTPSIGGSSQVSKQAGHLPSESGSHRGVKASKSNLASLVKLATIRRKVGQNKRKLTSSEVGVLDQDEGIDLPVTPRFCATLSPEAQYAMLKCYEDVLLDNIKTKKGENTNTILYRVKTPKDAVESLELVDETNMDKRKQISETSLTAMGSLYNLQSSMSKLTDEPRHDLEKLPAIIQVPLVPDSAGTSMFVSSNQMATGADGAVSSDPFTANQSRADVSTSSMSTITPKPIVISMHRQLRLSQRFQTAMDILDSMKQSEGEIVISPRRCNFTNINPVRYYNNWSKTWAREFQFKVSHVQKSDSTVKP